MSSSHKIEIISSQFSIEPSKVAPGTVGTSRNGEFKTKDNRSTYFYFGVQEFDKGRYSIPSKTKSVGTPSV